MTLFILVDCPVTSLLGKSVKINTNNKIYLCIKRDGKLLETKIF